MFKIDTKWLVIGVFAFGLCVSIIGYWHWTTSQLEHYKALSRQQQQKLNQQSAVISQLKIDIELNRQATAEITKYEGELRSKSNEVIKYIPAKIKRSDNFNADAPDNVIEFLRQ